MSRTAAERRSRRGYILEAARRLFEEKDLAACSMDEIAAAAEYTRRTLYSYFKTRDELYLLIHLEDLDRRWQLQQEALQEVSGGLARILCWAETLYAYCRSHPQVQRMESYWDFHGIHPERIAPAVFARFTELNEELAAGLRALLREGVADGTLRADLEVDLTISQFLYSLRAVIGRALSPGYSFAAFEPDAYFQHYLGLLGRGIRNSGETR